MDLFTRLEDRRQELGMSYAILARMSGVSMPTVVRILSAQRSNASFANVQAIADALEIDLVARERSPSDEICERQARQKASYLMTLLQGTSGLEGQAIDEAALSQMREQTVHELLAGSKRRLWSD